LDWGWLVVALLLRLGFAWHLGDRFHQIDELGYDAPAWQLARQGIIGTQGTAGVVPLIPASFFALFYLLGHQLLWPRLGQAFVSAAGAWLIGGMTRDLTRSPMAGRLALAAAALYPFFIYYSGMLLSETLYLITTTAGLWWLCLSLRGGGFPLWQAGASGLALALAALCRAEGAAIAALIWLAALIACLYGRWTWRAWLLAILCWALPCALWGIRNKAVTGYFSIDNHGGMALLHGSLLFELNEIDTGIAMKAVETMPFYRRAQALPEAKRDRIYILEALNFMRQNPSKTLTQWGKKFANFWRFYPRLDKPYHETIHSHPGAGLGPAALVTISLLWEPWLILGGLWGLWRLRKWWAELFPLGIFLVGTMGIHILSVSQMRYRLPVMPLLILGAAHLATHFVKSASQSTNR
jgi:hypothetical protein